VVVGLAVLREGSETVLFLYGIAASEGSEAASMLAGGAAGVAATLVGMAEGFLPATINLDTPDPDCDLDYVPNAIRRAEVEFALVNGIAFGSKNSALVLRNGRALPP